MARQFRWGVQHERLAFSEVAFHNTGLYNLNPKGDYPPNNTGVYEITHDPKDMGRFKAPSLSNISLTAPYMHDGSIQTLEEAIDHYAAGDAPLQRVPMPEWAALIPSKARSFRGLS